MKRSELVLKLAGRHRALSLEDVRSSVSLIIGAMSAELAAGGHIEIRGFGSMRTSVRKARVSRNPRNGARVDVPPRRVIHFRPALKMRKGV